LPEKKEKHSLEQGEGRNVQKAALNGRPWRGKGTMNRLSETVQTALGEDGALEGKKNGKGYYASRLRGGKDPLHTTRKKKKEIDW